MRGAGEHALVRADTDLLGFLAPGLVHGLGNHLFSIHGHVQLMRGGETELARQKTAVLKSSDKAAQALDVFRYMLGEPSATPSPQAGILLHRLCDYLRLPLRPRGLGLAFEHGSSETPLRVDGSVFCRAVVAVVQAMVELMPPGFEGVLHLDLSAQRGAAVSVTARLEYGPAQLPFPLDFTPVAALAPRLAATGVRLDPADGPELRLRVPVATE